MADVDTVVITGSCLTPGLKTKYFACHVSRDADGNPVTRENIPSIVEWWMRTAFRLRVLQRMETGSVLETLGVKFREAGVEQPRAIEEHNG